MLCANVLKILLIVDLREFVLLRESFISLLFITFSQVKALKLLLDQMRLELVF